MERIEERPGLLSPGRTAGFYFSFSLALKKTCLMVYSRLPAFPLPDHFLGLVWLAE